MNRTETDATDAAAVFYAEFLLPLRMANRRARLNYLDQQGGKTAGQPSYWAAIATRNGGDERVEAGQTDVAAMLDKLGAHWQQQGEDRLLQLLPYLAEMARGMNGRNAPIASIDETLPDFIYPMA